jgi:hypothetical protein
VSVARFLLGIPLSLATVGAVALAATAVRRRLVPLRTGPDALLVDLTLTLTAITVVSEALGTVGLFRVQALVAVCVLGGGGVWWVLRRLPPGEQATGERAAGEPVPATAEGPTTIAPAAAVGRWRLGVAIGALGLFVGSWLTRSINAVADGITTVDSQWYHLPFAIRFFQTGRTTGIQLIDADSVTAYFPATSSLLHSVGFLFFRIDLLSTVMNLGWLALALLAAWCLGRPHGVAPITTMGTAILLGGPGMVETQPGGALTDVVGIALLLAAAAIALHPHDRRSMGPDLVAALAAGLATGAKFTLLPPAGALCLGLIATAPAGHRLRRTVGVLGASLVSGGYWYVRNLVLVGNPLPSIAIGAGPVKLHQIKGVLPSSTVASLLTDREAWSTHLLPGLRDALGPAWPAVLGLSALGALLAIVRGPDPRVRMLGVVAVVADLAYLVTPQYLFGGIFFATNLRYAAPGLVLGLVLFPVVAREWRAWVLPAFAGVLVLTQLDPVAWSTGFGGPSFFASVQRSAAVRGALATLALLALGALAVAAWNRAPATRVRAPLAAVLAPLALLLVLTGVHGRYLDARYRGTKPFPAVYQWVRGVHHANIGVFGQYVYLKSPFAGPDLSNRVQYLGVDIGDGEWRPPKTCAEWVALLEQGRYDHVIIFGPDGAPGPATWTAGQPDAELVVQEGSAAGRTRVFSLDAGRRDRRCRPATPAG